jgi:hypothetical protein
MLIPRNQNAGGSFESQREHLGKNGSGTWRKFSECAESSNALGTLIERRQEMIKKLILLLFGYREKEQHIAEAIEQSCNIRLEADERMRTMRATLDGEDGWFMPDKPEQQG